MDAFISIFGINFAQTPSMPFHKCGSINSICVSFYSIYSQTVDDKDKENSPFDTNGLKKDESVSTNGGINGIDDDKGFK